MEKTVKNVNFSGEGLRKNTSMISLGNKRGDGVQNEMIASQPCGYIKCEVK